MKLAVSLRIAVCNQDFSSNTCHPVAHNLLWQHLADSTAKDGRILADEVDQVPEKPFPVVGDRPAPPPPGRSEIQ